MDYDIELVRDLAAMLGYRDIYEYIQYDKKMLKGNLPGYWDAPIPNFPDSLREAWRVMDFMRKQPAATWNRFRASIGDGLLYADESQAARLICLAARDAYQVEAEGE